MEGYGLNLWLSLIFGDFAISTTAKLALLYGYRTVLLVLLVVVLYGRWELGRLILQAWGVMIVPGILAEFLSRLQPPNRFVFFRFAFFYQAALIVWNGMGLVDWQRPIWK